MMFETFLIFVTCAYALQSLVLLFGVHRGRDARGPATPPVTVVIAARNEELTLAECLSSVLRQTYPVDRYSVILANDRSTDATERICRETSASHANFSYFDVNEAGTLRGKSNALAQAIDRAQGEIIMITDADCVVPATWVEETVKRYSSLNVGLVGGITLQKSSSPFTGMQSLDWAYILGGAAANAAWGNLLGSIGNNLSFRKSAYDEVGGYRNIPFSVTEDYALVQAIVRTGHWEYLYPIDESLLVLSSPCRDIRTLVRQKHRWAKGGLDMKLSGFLLLLVTGLMHVSPVIVLFWGKFVLASFCATVKFTLDYAFLNAVLTRVNRRSELQYFFWFELYYSFYVVFLPVLALFGGKVIWKGRVY